MTRRRRRLLWALAAVVVLGAWGALAALSVTRARSDVNAGLASIRKAEKLTSAGDLVDGKPLAHLRDAGEAFDDAHDRLASLWVSPLKVLPVLGRQVRSATALAGAAGEVSDVGADAVTEAQRALRQPHGTGPERIALLRELGRLAGHAERRLAAIDLGPSRALVGTLSDKRAEVKDRLDDIREGLRDGRVAAGGLADILQGPRRYLVLAANNSEMRAGSGMFLSVGELHFADGAFSLGEVRPATELVPNPPPPITDADYAARWGWLNPNREWRNLGASPRFDATAELASRMWVAAGGAPLDGVLALDPIALQSIMEATGPLEVEGRRIAAEALDDLLLHDQYTGIHSLAGEAQIHRRELLGLIAKGALGAIQGGEWDTAKLAEGLARAARGRHLLAWAGHPAEEAVWEGAGIDGRLADDSLLLAVLNRGGNKLDRFLTVEARLGFTPEGRDTVGELQVTLTNTTPPGESLYIAGPYPGSGVGAGDYLGILSVSLPAFVGDVTSDGGNPTAAGNDGPTRVLAVQVRVDRGRSKTVTFRFRVAARHGSLRVEPSARVPAVQWTAPGGSWSSAEARRVEW